MAKPVIPEGQAFSNAWRALDRPARQRVRRAANRAQPAENKKEAALAVAVARGQQRFWRFAWLLGPALAALLLFTEPWQTVLVNILLATLLFAVLRFLFVRRARLAEAVNLEVASGKRRKQPR
jgi:MFS family permease